MTISLSRRLSACVIFDKPQYFIVHGFPAGLAEMDGYPVVGGADPLREYA